MGQKISNNLKCLLKGNWLIVYVGIRRGNDLGLLDGALCGKIYRKLGVDEVLK